MIQHATKNGSEIGNLCLTEKTRMIIW